MGSSYDIERVFPGTEHEEFTKENLTELNRRIVKLETILAQRVTQWNAPTLIRGNINNGSNPAETRELYYQAGRVTMPYTASRVGSYLYIPVTFPISFSEAPLVVGGFDGVSFNAMPYFITCTSANTTGFTLYLRPNWWPTTGTCTIVWHAIGKKVF